jgi:hypothetical protein
MNVRLDSLEDRRENEYRHPDSCIINISIAQKKRATGESWEEESMYTSFELIYGALNQISWCYDVFCLYIVNGMLMVVCSLCYAFALILFVCMISY